MQMIEAAKSYAANGWKVFPLRPRSKKPQTTHGLKDASLDIKQIADWWKSWPAANVGIALGTASGVFMVDCDPVTEKNAHNGMATWATLQAHYGQVGETRQQHSGGGGEQFFFEHPGVDVQSHTKLLPGIDIKADGGYVVASPSIHPDTGREYAWANECPPIPAPAWLLSILFDDEARLEALRVLMPDAAERQAWCREYWRKSPELRAAKAKPAQPEAPTLPAESDEMRHWLSVTTAKAYQAVASAGKGSRNAALNRETYSLAGLIPHISQSDIESLMYMAAEQSGYVADDGEGAVKNVIKSAIESGSKATRQLPALTPARQGVTLPAMDDTEEYVPSDAVEGGETETEAAQPRPKIQTNNVELPDITAASIRALKKLGGIYVRGNELVRVRVDEKCRASIEVMNEAALCGRMARAAIYCTVRYNEKKDEFSETLVAPPINAVRDVMTIGDWPFPPLDGVIESPAMRPDGTIVLQRGYDAATRLYLAMQSGLQLPEIPDEPSQQDIEASLALLSDMFVDMPFEDASSRANALGALITPIARPMIAGPVPMPLFDSPQQGSGKTLTAQLIGLVATGEMSEPSPAPDAPEEWRKSISAQLMDARSVILIDNITKTLEDGALAAVLTSTTWSDRLLGRNDKKIRLPARACWMATGNNVKVGGDLVTRTYPIRLDAKMSRPQEREGFKHPNIEQWVKANRGLLLKSALVLCRAWHVAGRPAPSCPRIRYSEWRNVVGGILQYAGVSDFLGNLRDFQESADIEGPAWERFILKLIEVFGSTVAPVQIYARFAASDELAATLPPELAGKLSGPDDHKAKSQFSQRIGYLFRERIGKRYGDSQACIVLQKRVSDGSVWELRSGD